MRAVVQRARASRVEVAGEVVGAIERGLVVFLAAGKGDEARDVAYMAEKLSTLRVFEDDAGKMSRPLADVAGAGMLVVSQFTLYGDVRRGRRPSFDEAMEPVRAEELVAGFVEDVRRRGLQVATGRFRADMRVFVENDGPVTLLVDSRKGA